MTRHQHLQATLRRYFGFCVLVFLLCPAIAAARGEGAGQESVIFPEALKGLSISDTFVPLYARPVGTVESVQGRLVVRHGDSPRAYQAAPGNELYEHDVLFTVGESRCRIKFAADDIVTMGANSRLSVDESAADRDGQEKKSAFSVLEGKVMFYVLRLFRYKKVAVDVRTPTVVAGIRGTKFGVDVVRTETREASVRQPYLADISGRIPAGLLAQNTPGQGYQTTVYGFDGEVQVTSTGDGTTQTVGAGESVVVGAAGAGPVMPTPPGQGQQFNSETSAPAGGGGEGGADSGEGGSGAGPEGAAVPEDTGGEQESTGLETTDFIQNETTQAISQDAQQPVSGNYVGYFSAILAGSYIESAPQLVDVYANSSRADLNGTGVSGESIVNSQGYIAATGTGQASEQTYLTRIRSMASIASPTSAVDTGDLGTGAPMDELSNDRLGSNAYMDWGVWAMTTPVQNPFSGYSYAITSGYYLGGEATPDAAVPGISGTYAGPAYGTLTDGAAGIAVTGGFSCIVKGLAGTISDFQLGVSDAETGKFAIIENGSGAFIGSSSEFKISGGQFYLNTMETTAGNKSCQGSLYGPNGENMGGNWAMQAGSEAAVGIFVGTNIGQRPQ